MTPSPPKASAGRPWLSLAIAVLATWCAMPPARAAKPPSARPNIVFILADDLGWSDLGCYGADLHETPNIDRLARDGVRFTQAYAMPVCSPTRAAILTGRHAARLHYTIWREGSVERGERIAKSNARLLPPETIADLPHAEATLAEVLQGAGYRTFHVGKWHLGDAGYSPETQGFEVNVGGTHWGAPESYFWPYRGTNRFREFRYVPGLGPGKPGDYLTDRLTDEALQLIDAAGSQPFFLNLWYHDPHTPIEGKPALVEHFRARLRPGMHHQNPGYAAMIRTLDDNVGRVLRHLERRRLADKTIVVFASDNGGYLSDSSGQRISNNFPLRSGKGSLYEGGIRVPVIVRWPGIAARNAVCADPIQCTDFMPTLAEAAGVRAERAVDGVSFTPLLRQPASHLGRDALFFHYPHYYSTTTPASAVRVGDLKLVHYFEDGRDELFDLAADPGETTDLAAARRPDVTRLRARLDGWYRTVDAQMPSINPAFREKP